MGVNASSLAQSSGDCHSLASRRRNNRLAFAESVGSLRAELARGEVPLPLRAISGPGRARVIVRKRPLFAHEVADDFDVVSCEAGRAGTVWDDSDPDTVADAAWVTRGNATAASLSLSLSLLVQKPGTRVRAKRTRTNCLAYRDAVR